MPLLTPAVRERLLLALLGVAAATGAVAAILPAAAGPARQPLARLAAVTTIALLLTCHVLARRVDTLRTFAARSPTVEAKRHWAFLRNAALTVETLLALTAIHATLLVMTRAGVALPTVTRVEPAANAVLALFLALSVPAAFYYTLRVPLEPRTSGLARLARGLLLTGVVLIAAVIVVLTARSRIPYPLPALEPPLLLVAGLALLGLALIPDRGLPTPYTLLTEPREYYGAPPASRTRSFLVPATLAFSILFVAFFLIVFFGVGQAGLQQPIQLAVIVFIVGSMATSIGLSLRLARSQERRRFEAERLAGEGRAGVAVFLAGALLSAILFGAAGLLFAGISVLRIPTHAWTDAFALGLLLGLGPYGYFIWARERRIQRLEERFPDFLRDVAASHTAGLTITSSVRIAAKGDYGALGPEIRAMADQLSWDVALDEVLLLFADRVGTPLIRRSVGLIIEASRSGGNTSDVLMAAAVDAREIKALESQRRATMSLYTVVVYITFLVFLGVVALLYATLVPQLLEAGGRLATVGASDTGGVSLDVPTRQEYRVYYFLTSIVQALGNGALVGLLQAGRARLGLRHAFNMVLITYATFLLLS